MGERLGAMATGAFGLAVAAGILAIPFIFIKGALWASEKLLPPLVIIGWVALALVLAILLPLSLFKRLRGFTGATIVLSSCVFGLVCWLLGFIVTYELWGLWAIIVGLLFLGGGVVPIGMLASALGGDWQTVGVLAALVLLTFGSRFLGIFIASAAD